MSPDNRKIQCVSFPRSGHHLLTECLRQYFDKGFHYCPDVFRNVQFKDSKTNYQKNHDFDLSLPNIPEWCYVIQYRHPIESIISWYRWEVEYGVKAERNFGWRPLINQRLPLWNLYTRRDTFKRWSDFVERRLPFWKGFVRKWILQNQNPKTVFVHYGDLVNNSYETLENVIQFVKPSDTVRRETITQIVKRMNIEMKHSIQNFKYCDVAFFRKIEDSVSDELRELNIERQF